MPMSLEELDRLADEQYTNRRIPASTFCGKCGYNLRGLPYVYHCPECGSDYNASPRRMSGIYQPSAAEFPFGDLAAALLCAAMGGSLVARSVSPPAWGSLSFGVMLCLMCVTFGVKAIVRLLRYSRGRGVARRIVEAELEDE